VTPVDTLLSSLLGMTLLVIGWLVTRVVTLNQLADTKQETIEDLRRQVSSLEVTAKIQDRFFTMIPKAPGEKP
jgi:hypothetical protein